MGKKKISNIPNATFALPASLVEPILQMHHILGIKPQKAEIRVDAFIVDAYLFTPTDNFPFDALFSQVCGFSGLKKEDVGTVLCLLDGKTIPLFVDSTLEVIVDFDKTVEKEEYDKIPIGVAISHYLPILEKFARITNNNVCLHANMDNVIPGDENKAPVFQDGMFHIFSKSRPPGDAETETRYVNKAFGMKIAEAGNFLYSAHPTKGRGILVFDDEKGNLAQILGKNFYFLIPIFWNFDSARPCKDIFEKILIRTWDTYRANLNKKKDSEPAEESEFVEMAKTWIGKKSDFFKKKLKENEEKTQQLQKELLKCISVQKETTALLDTFSSSSYIRESLERLPGDFEKISHLPEVAKVSLVDEGLHVETGKITINHGGVDYLIADSYTIRLNKKGEISIWTETSHHKENVAHPHIGRLDNICFGNATMAILKASGEHRIFDTINYLLRWMTVGYTHVLATHKVTEWPTVEEAEKKEKEATFHGERD